MVSLLVSNMSSIRHVLAYRGNRGFLCPAEHPRFYWGVPQQSRAPASFEEKAGSRLSRGGGALS